jgi:DNA-binding beta-propeller fold protein YncE
MPARSRKTLLINALTRGAALVALGAFASTASADGLPVLGVDVGGQGVTVLGSHVRYVTLHTGPETVVARIAANGGRVLRFTRIRGNFTIPAVAYDGSSSGLAADGSTLALIQPRLSFPRARTAFVVLDARRLRVRKSINLRGDFSFDAISRDGRTLFFIEYVSPRDPTRYNVRAYDVLSGRLLAKPVVDPHEGQEAMRGSPLTRTTSPDGRWAYTLYDGAGKTPFVHALDTSRREARCIDLPMLVLGGGPLHLTVAPNAAKLTVSTRGRTVAVIDTSTFQASRPDEPTANHVRPANGRARGSLVYGGAALATILAASTILAALRRRRRRPPAPESRTAVA